MKKEQMLLVCAVGVTGLLVLTNSGLYERVGAGTLGEGTDVDVRASVIADPSVAASPPGGRNLVQQMRTEQRPVRPELDLPPSIGFPWVRPIPWPEVPPAFWGPFREEMKKVAPPKAEETAAADTSTQADPVDPVAEAARLAAEEKAAEEKVAKERVENAAKLVMKDGRSFPVILTPTGPDQGQPVWVILEKWPAVQFRVDELNNDGRTVRGSYPVAPGGADQYQTTHLEKGILENEYHEERIRRGVKASDRQAQIDFANWIRQVLAPKYGIPATRLALTHLRTAAGLLLDTSLIVQIGDTCREAWDLDAEVKAYTEFLTGPRAADTTVIVRLGQAYAAGGAFHSAREQFEKAAKLGDVEGRLRLAGILLQLAGTQENRDAAYAEFERATTAASPSQKARALAGMARAQLVGGNAANAVRLATDARTTDAASFEAHVVLGVAQYATGKFADAEKSFATAATLEPDGGTRAKSNQAMALLAQDKLTEAVQLAQQCLDTDALNYLDPLLVMGEAQQHWGDLTKGNDLFQTAKQRHPRNAWVLLRLASIRLRDQNPAQALEIAAGTDTAQGLLQLAPECVDALHVAGLACAALDTPDWARAAKYLGRAHEKEPRNAEILYDHGKVLHLAGRTDQAIQLLERATDANVGVAKTDARLLALLAWMQFDSGRPVGDVFASISRARNVTQASWTTDWFDRAYKRVYDWDRTRIAIHNFRTAPGGKVPGGWTEVESLGTVRISVDGEHVVMSGTAAAADDRAKYTGMWRTEDLAQLQSFEATVKAEGTFEFVVHIYQGELPSTTQQPTPTPGTGRRPGGRANSAELGLGRDRTGKMMLWVFTGDNRQFNVPIKNADGTDRAWPTDDAFHKVSFRRIGLPSKGEWEILFDDEKVPTTDVAEVGALSAAAGRSANVGIHLDGDHGANVKLVVDEIQIEKILGKR